MDKLFVNKTTYSQETYIDFLKFHNKKFNLSYIMYTMFWSFMFLLCIILSFSSNMRLQGVLITIILVIFIIYRFARPKMIVEKEMSSEKISTNNTNTFTFYNNIISISNKNGKFSYKYFMFRKIFETSDFFYLYVSKENAFLINKNSFSLGNAEDFAIFLKRKCPLKYKKCI